MEGEPQRGVRRGGNLNGIWPVVWRWLLRLLVLGGFVGGVAVFWFLLQQAGVVGDGNSLAGETRFEDVAEDSPFLDEIEQVVDLGIMSGINDNLFAPRGPVNRGQFATILVRAMEWRVSANETQPFSDVEDRPVLDTADHIAVVFQRKIMEGKTNDPPTFTPEESISLQNAIIVTVRAGGDDLQTPITPDREIQEGLYSPALEQALQVAQANGLLTGLDIDVRETDFSKPVQRQEMAVLMVNLRTALRL